MVWLEKYKGEGSYQENRPLVFFSTRFNQVLNLVKAGVAVYDLTQEFLAYKPESNTFISNGFYHGTSIAVAKTFNPNLVNNLENSERPLIDSFEFKDDNYYLTGVGAKEKSDSFMIYLKIQFPDEDLLNGKVDSKPIYLKDVSDANTTKIDANGEPMDLANNKPYVLTENFVDTETKLEFNISRGFFKKDFFKDPLIAKDKDNRVFPVVIPTVLMNRRITTKFYSHNTRTE